MSQNRRSRGVRATNEGREIVEASRISKNWTRQTLADRVGVSLDTLERLIKGDKVDRETIIRVTQVLDLQPTNIVDPDEWNRAPRPAEAEIITKTFTPRVFLSYHNQDLNLSLAQQLCDGLQAARQEVFLAGETVQREANWPQHFDKELEQCDCFVLLLSPQAAVSEMVTEAVRRARELRNSRPNSKPKILPIHVGMNSRLNHDLRGYLKGIQQWEWQSDDPTTLVQAVLSLLAEEQIPDVLVPVDSLPPAPPAPSIERPTPVAEPGFPAGQVPLASAFYIERPPIESECYQEILQPGALISIKAPRQMGKTSLMSRILYQAKEHGYQTVPLSFQLADKAVFTNLDSLLRWFCERVGRRLRQLEQLEDYWTSYGTKDKASFYFEECLLEGIASPLVIGLDEVDRVFPYLDIADDFFGLLRAWFESARHGDSFTETWQKLRVVVVHSTEAYIPLDINQSPFNVGLSVELQEFDFQQVQHLISLHGELDLTATQVEKLMEMVGGHPYLVRLALYHLKRQDVTFEELLQQAPTESGIYTDHLRRHLWNLKQYPELAAAFSRVVMSDEPVELDSELAFKLHSMGLVHRQGNKVTPRCKLYRLYFRDRLSDL